MTPSREFKQFILERLECTGPISTSRFFGGIGLRRDGVQFGMLMGNSLYFVVDDSTRQNYINAGSEPFSYLTKNRRVHVRRYFEVPHDVIEQDEVLKEWAARAVATATVA